MSVGQPEIEARISALLAELTIAEKASLLTGGDFWRTAANEERSIPAIMMTDGPYGLRKQPEEGDHLGIGNSTPATCFPPTVALGSSFDAALIERVGAAIGAEAKQEGVSIVLGPGVNIKRSPLCGRNFEYFSEDPILSGDLGAAWIKGVQSQGVGTSLKHYAVNNQEHQRMTISADVAQRPLHEIYLRPFKIAVQREQPWTVMCSYNRVNGEFASQNRELLTEILRDQWGFEGLVVSDWGAVLDRAAAVAAGLDLEMPSTGTVGPRRVVDAVESGELSAADVDATVARVLRLVFTAAAHLDAAASYDPAAHHELAKEAATRGAVLLKNDDDLLPISVDTARIAVIGEFARSPRFQGAGSSQIVPTRLDSALDAITATARGEVVFSPGFTLDDVADQALAAQAAEVAAGCDVAIVFLGLPGSAESEGFDRTTIDLPQNQRDLLAEVAAANPRTVVVLSNGAVVRLTPWIDQVPALLEGWLLGQAGGSATAELLFGAANPSGKLTETIPLRLEDNPSYLNFPGESGHVLYGEGIHVGYRWYDAKDIEVAFPFGYGLSYTTFSFDSVSVAPAATGGIDVTVDVTNTGSRSGREVVQVYIGRDDSRVVRPLRELKAYAPVDLEPGQTASVVLHISREALSYYDSAALQWLVEGGTYQVEVGSSSRDIELAATVEVDADPYLPPLTIDSTVAEWLSHPVVGGQIQERLQALAAGFGSGGDEQIDDFIAHMLSGSRLSSLIGMMGERGEGLAEEFRAIVAEAAQS